MTTRKPDSIGADQSEIDPRLVFAAEQNLLAWIRTGISLMGLGFVVARFGLFLRELAAGPHHSTLTSTGFPLVVGSTLVVIGVVVNIIEARQHSKSVADLNRREKLITAPASARTVVAVLLVAIGTGVAIYLISTDV